MALGAAFRIPAARAFGLELSAYSILGLAGVGFNESVRSEGHINAFLQLQGVEVPVGKTIDRLGHIDFDDIFLIGAATGVAIASSLQRPWCLSGWKRWLGSAAIGASVSTWTFTLTRPFLMSKEDQEKLIKRFKEQQGWNIAISKSVVLLEEAKLRAAGIIVPATAGSPQMLDMPQQQAKVGPVPREVTGLNKIGFDGVSWRNASDEPHLTDPLPGDDKPLPYANTNYAWTRPTQQAIKELEEHVARLRERREKVAQEAELLWHWLARKEADYYNASSAPFSESDEKLAARRYVETLGNAHGKVWQEVSKCDWMMADARKRIQQLQSSLADGKVTWMPGLSPAASRAKPEISKMLFQNYAQQVEGRKRAMESNKQQLSRSIPTSGWRAGSNKNVHDPLSGQQTTIKQLAQDLQKRIEADLEAAKLDSDVLQQVLSDAESLQKSADE